ncbi:MAG: hypothetical protein IJM59_05940 [Proteobacteria bacterium]|nr:hypothetical protein [Pseudomonadota bacterium]
MKLDKRFVLAAAFVMGIGIGAAACSESDSDGDNGGDNGGKPAATCDKKAEDCTKDGKKLDQEKCECVKKEEKQKDPNCGNGKLDEGEVCDIVDGVEAFADGKGTCEAWASENDETLDASAEQGKPGCSSDCKGHSKAQKSGNGCVTVAATLCGNGKIDDGEKCDKDADGNIIFAPSETDHSCKATYGKGSGDFVADGVPTCAKDCKGYGKGTCEDNKGGESQEGGIKSCVPDIKYAENKVTGNATVEAGDASAKIKGAVICGEMNENIEKAVNIYAADDKLKDAADGKITSELATDGFPAGEYGCVYYVKAGDKGYVCTADGVKDAKGKVSDLVKEKTFVIEGADTSSAIASWSDFSAVASIDVLVAGFVSQDGSDKTAKITWINGIESAVTAKPESKQLRLEHFDTKGSGNTAAENAYFEVSFAALAADAELVINMETRDSVFVVTNDKDEPLNSNPAEIKSAKGTFTDFKVTVPKDATSVRIYNKAPTGKAVFVTSIVLK